MGVIEIEKYKKFIYISLSVILGIILAYALVKYIILIAVPFIFAFFTVASLKNTVNKISKKTKIPQIIIVILLSIIVLSIVTAIIIFFAGSIEDIIEMFKIELSKENNVFEILISKIREVEARLPFLKKLDNTNGGIVSIFAEIVGDVVKKCSLEITMLVTNIPKLILTAFVTIMALFYFTKDYDKIKELSIKYLPKKAYRVSAFMKNNIINVLTKYLKSYLLLFVLTFSQLLAGFLILGIKSPLAPALIIGILDMLPVLGSSMILIAWALIMLLYGNIKTGVGLIILAVIIYIIRQLAEPKLLSKQMNVHPLITLFFMYAGFKLSGILGMLFAPIIPFILKPVIEVLKKSKNTVDNKNKL